MTTQDKKWWEIPYDGDDTRFDTFLAHFIAFIEDEAKRIDEERNGARRRDGGRVMQSSAFLRDLVSHIEQETRRRVANEIIQIIKDSGHQQEDDTIWCDMDEVLKKIEIYQGNEKKG